MFTTYNQFDKRFNLYDNRTACPLFSLITAHNFMKNGNISQAQHEENINSAVEICLKQDIPKYMSFNELIAYTNGVYNFNDIMATSPELIKENIIGYETIFTNKNRHCVIFLKNRNFITVLFDNNKYSLRDCHENNQYDFSSLEELKNHLNEKYQFDKLTIVDGVLIEEFSNIEFIIINQPFQITNLICKDNDCTYDEILAMQLQYED